MAKPSSIRKQSFSFLELPAEDKSGQFLVVLECTKCKELAYAKAEWKDGVLDLIGRSHGESKATRISHECTCQDSPVSAMNFVQFETSLEDDSNDSFPSKMRLWTAAGLAAQAFASLRFDFPYTFMGSFMVSAMLALFAITIFKWWASWPESMTRYYLALAASTWLPAVVMFTLPA